jgi:hypothetical protein
MELVKRHFKEDETNAKYQEDMVFTCYDFIFVSLAGRLLRKTSTTLCIPTVSVTQEVAPDTAFVSMGVVTRGKTAEEARASQCGSNGGGRFLSRRFWDFGG